MLNSFYIAKNKQLAILFILENTNWVRVGQLSFVNGNEHIAVKGPDAYAGIVSSDSKVYIDYSFEEINPMDKKSLTDRFNHCGITPTVIHDIHRAAPYSDKILMCAENMNGHKLEDLLLKLCKELLAKSESILKTQALQEIAHDTCDSNFKIIRLLEEAIEVQLATMERHTAFHKKTI